MDGGGFIHILQQENCRFAYTLNNAQPVRCSIIGDQPLFYMDFEGDIEDEFADEFAENGEFGADPFGISAIEEGVAALKDRLQKMEGDIGEAFAMTEYAQMRMADFQDEAILMTRHSAPEHNDYTFRLKSLEKILQESRMAAAFLETARSYGITLQFDARVENAFYDRDAQLILLNPDRDETTLILLAVRELRRAWQHKNGALLHPLTFHPDQAILVNRTQRADLSVAMIRAAWEMQLSGNRGPWDRLENSSLSDLTRAFAREAYLDFRTLNNGQAASAVFEAWFLSERCRHEDRALIQQMLSDYQGYVFDAEQVSRSVSSDLLLALGSMPFGKNYLSPFVASITTDPLFAEVRDRSNANFLWFIKFERSFREAEQELQTTSPIQDHGAPRGSSITKKLDGDDEQTPTVIALPGMASRDVSQPKLPAAARAAQKDGTVAGNAGNDGNIVYLNRRTTGI
jgi:hypothetical protein